MKLYMLLDPHCYVYDLETKKNYAEVICPNCTILQALTTLLLGARERISLITGLADASLARSYLLKMPLQNVQKILLINTNLLKCLQPMLLIGKVSEYHNMHWKTLI